jgi:hypothetical protein
MVTVVKPMPGEVLGGDSAGPLRNAPNVMGAADSVIAVTATMNRSIRDWRFTLLPPKRRYPQMGGADILIVYPDRRY